MACTNVYKYGIKAFKNNVLTDNNKVTSNTGYSGHRNVFLIRLQLQCYTHIPVEIGVLCA